LTLILKKKIKKSQTSAAPTKVSLFFAGNKKPDNSIGRGLARQAGNSVWADCLAFAKYIHIFPEVSPA
jgi:hypothetical protein